MNEHTVHRALTSGEKFHLAAGRPTSLVVTLCGIKGATANAPTLAEERETFVIDLGSYTHCKRCTSIFRRKAAACHARA